MPNGGAEAAAENNVSTNWASASNTAPFEFATDNYGTPGAQNRDWNPTAVTFSQQGIATTSTLASVVFLVLGLLAATTAVFIRRQQV